MGEDFAWTIPLIHGAFGFLFLCARRAGAPVEARFWGLGFILSGAAFAVPALLPVLPVPLVAFAADTLFATAFFCFGEALVARYGVRQFARARLAFLFAVIAASAIAVLWLDSLPLELLFSDIGCAGQVAFALLLVRVWPPTPADRAVIAVSWLVVVDNLVRTAIAPLTAPGGTLASFADTDYAYLMQASAFLTGLAFAIAALLAIATDMLAGYRRDADADPLTGLLNRRGLQSAVARIGGEPGDGLVSCDLDHFKAVNDTFGHDAGDRVLIAFADLIRQVLPPGALAGRPGGEEFVLYVPGRLGLGAERVAIDLRNAMAAHDWSREGLSASQTASFGVAVRQLEDAGIADLARRADACLYEAKRCGRDQIRSALAA
ncbi:GGDEF domain-containing protein [Aureimonas sp. ME7]|uniref:GGDEF domain-containing protein n=1 Tax=Aureimonas sp. ME7 TaxID=2744252 RepID=UPI0015F6C666|nr:GGDEF domain-containing protein [Aureimonas sp. ME7]